MKKVLKITGGIILGLIVLMMVLPALFKGKIEKLVKEQINTNVNARVDYTDFSLSLIKNFPNITIGIDGLSVVGNVPFEKDTLVYLDKFSGKVGLFGALAGEIEVKSVLLSNVLVNALVLADSTANWDIAKGSEEVVMEEEESEASAFKVVLQSFVIENANIRYVDQTANMQSEIKGFNLSLSGDMSAQQTNLEIQSDIAQLMFDYDGIKYVNKASLGLKAGIGADLENMIFSFLENELSVNGLVLKLDGSVAVKEKGYGLDLKMGTTKTDFKSLLALVPEEFLKDFEGLQTQGTMHVDMVVKGDYIDEEHLPAFTLDLGVENGMIQYPDLPESIDNINVALLVKNVGGSADLTETELKQFHFEIAQNPFDASFKVRNPISNPQFDSRVVGRIDLNSLANAIPLDSFEIKGLIETDFAIAGDYAMIESENYEQINARGELALNNFSYQGADMSLPVFIKQSVMSVNPRSVRLESFDCRIGKSDFNLKGSLDNYLAYALKDGTLKGSLTHYSKLINTNELLKMAGSEDESASEAGETEVVEVPKNLDFVFQSQVEQLVYDKLDIYRANGKITVRNGVVKLDGLKMRLLDGSLAMTGEYNTADMQKPFVDFAFEGADLDLNMAANSFSVVDSLLPLAKNTVGKVSPKFKYNSLLSRNAKPVMATVNGGGWLRSQKVEVSGSKIQNSLASTLNNESYRTMRAEDLNINFILDKGNVIVKPFKTKVGGKMVEVQGVQGLDQSIDYKITMPVSRKEVAKMAGSFGFSLPTSGDDLIVDVLVKGTVQEPQLSFGLDKAKKQIEKDLKKEGENLLKNLLKGF
ncbi:AsmA family protein [Carboxylicivirga mesophila]|uniref:AsmA family protein n=1 Tax=Carboxylicivirga mesophila TaxID=1166478 RepID=A0ABS5K7G1_9BACT|nr:AsmA-like C-terminal region-containing protein [Carboxylicivirga mesophila]MBS2210928.1 AsmA family protein [Carboxylicivirga mesophila]